MNRHSKNDTIRMDIIKAHIDDLIAQGLIRYRFFLILNEHQISTDVRNTIRNTFIEILQFTSQQQLCNDKHLLRNAEGLLKLEEDDIGLLFRIWADCFKAADSSRKTMKLLCSEFLTLIQNLPKELHGKPLQPIPQFFRQHGHAAFKLIPTVVHNVGNTSTYEDSVKCLNLIEQYISAVSLKTLAAFSSLITIICQKCGNQYLDKLVQACPPKVFGHDHQGPHGLHAEP